MHRWMAPGVIIGIESNNLWISHRGAVIKAANRHVRPAEPEELVPWNQIYEMAGEDQLPPVPNEYLDLNEPARAVPPPAQGAGPQEEAVEGAGPPPPVQPQQPEEERRTTRRSRSGHELGR